MSYTINSQNTTQENFIELACNPQKNIVVKACAGSGKTWLLASRIVRILVEGGNHQNILAITFTKKAAQEMKQRVMEYLHKFSYINDADLRQELKDRGIKLSDINIKRARKLYFHILSSPYTLNISTFHVWFAQLTSLAPISHAINYSNIREDEQIMYDDAIQEFISSPIYNNYQYIFNEFLQKWNISSLISNSTIMQVWKNRADILEYTSYEYLQKFAYPTKQDIEILKQKILPNFNIPKSLYDIIDQTIILLKGNKGKAGQDIANNLIEVVEKNDISLLEDVLLTKGQKIRSTKVTEFEGLASSILQYYYDLYNQAFTEIAKIFIYAYTYYKYSNSTVDFNDLQTNAKFLIQQDDVAQYIWCRLDNKYKHILFDEFQDTDDTQWEIIKSWLNAYSIADENKPNIFIVGDLKQAIYRFRGSNSNVFIKASKYLQENYNANILATYNTRRCSQKIVNWLNAGLCSDDDIDNYQNDYLPHTTSQQYYINNNDDIYNNHTYTLNLTEDSYKSAIQLSSIIKYLHQNNGIKYQDILVLTPNRNNWQEFEQELSVNNIPCVVNRQGGLLQTQEVYIIINLIRFLLDNHNNYAVFCILTSPIFNIKSEDLLRIVKNNPENKDKSYWQILDDFYKNDNINHVNFTHIVDAIEKLNYLTSIYKNYTPLDLIQFLYLNLDIKNKFIQNLAKYNTTNNLGKIHQIQYNLQEFIKVILNFNAGRYPNLIDLLDFILKYQYTSYIKETPNIGIYQQENAVRFDTIHGAKGLESNIVILMDSTYYKNFTTNILKCNNNFLVGKPHMHRLIEERQFSWDYQQNEHDKEYKNLLYVSITRAKKMFILGGIQGKNSADSKIWYNKLTNITNESVYEKLDDINITLDNQNIKHNNGLKSIYQNKLNLEEVSLQENTLPIINPREIPNIGQKIGTIMHKLLELITEFKYKDNSYEIPDIEKAMLWLKITKHKKFMLELALEKVEKILNTQNLQHIFYHTLYIKAMNEKSFSYQGKIYRMDRIVQLLDKSWLIIDYKFGDEQKHLQEYQQQLGIYRKILAANFNIAKEQITAVIINSNAELIQVY